MITKYIIQACMSHQETTQNKLWYIIHQTLEVSSNSA